MLYDIFIIIAIIAVAIIVLRLNTIKVLWKSKASVDLYVAAEIIDLLPDTSQVESAKTKVDSYLS